MSINKYETQELLRLFKLTVDIGTEVLYAFADTKRLKAYGGSFFHFCEDKKHQIFHLWHPKQLLCCECPPAGCGLKRTGHMENWIFRKIYDDTGKENRKHIITNGKKNIQVCLHKFITQHNAIHEMDIIVVSFLLREMATLSQSEIAALNTVTTKRNQICHVYSTSCYSISELNTIWNELENALTDLTNTSYNRLLQMQITALKKVCLEKQEITELSSKLMMLKADTLGLTNCLQEVQSSTSEAKDIGNKILTKMEKFITNQATGTSGTNAKLGEIVEILHKMNKTGFSVICEQSAHLLRGQEMCHVLWKLVTPENWNTEEVKQMLTKLDACFQDLPFKIKFVRTGSIVIMTTVDAKVMKDSTAFQSAVKSFLTRMVEVCNIDTTVKCNVGVTLRILNSDELKVMYRLPNTSTEVKLDQTDDVDYEQQKRVTKHRNESEKFDVAFLNGDHEKEIRWVHNMSSLLKAQYDITCAIPAKDYLYGFPLKNRLGRYLKKFKVVILTVTKTNYTEYYDYIESDMPIIAVELDYISHIRWTLWDCPYINCTTCQHLWFPRLIDTLKPKLPDHLKEKIGHVEGKLVADCEKCDATGLTPVYHLVDFRKGLNEEKLLLCGSLADEAWILLLLNQMTKLGDPNWIFKWDKKIDKEFTSVTPSIVFVLVSTNLQKCPSITEYANSVVKDKTASVYSLKLSQVESPHFHGQLPKCIDATIMNMKDLAHAIFLAASERRQKSRSSFGYLQDVDEIRSQKAHGSIEHWEKIEVMGSQKARSSFGYLQDVDEIRSQKAHGSIEHLEKIELMGSQKAHGSIEHLEKIELMGSQKACGSIEHLEKIELMGLPDQTNYGYDPV